METIDSSMSAHIFIDTIETVETVGPFVGRRFTQLKLGVNEHR